MCNIGDPEQAFKLAQWPNDGVGLARMEFIFASWVKVHPLALLRFETLPIATQREIEKLTVGYTDKSDYFVDKLAQGIGMLAAAFWPKPVILRFSDFKTNEYAHLIGGASFEPHEDNPDAGLAWSQPLLPSRLQAPSDYPEFAVFLVEQGIDSISLNPDSVVKGKQRIQAAEKAKK